MNNIKYDHREFKKWDLPEFESRDVRILFTFWRTVFMPTVGGRSNAAFHNAVAAALDIVADDTRAFRER